MKLALVHAHACLLAGATTLAAAAAEGQFTLTVLHSNDGESKLLYPAPSLSQFGGIARFRTLVDRLREAGLANGGCLMLSSGDNFLAGPEWNASLTNGVPYYDAIGMQLVGYDGVCIGNHDFDFGPDILANFVASFTDGTPFLSANLDLSGEPALVALEGAGRIVASRVVTTAGRSIGLVGATTPDLPFISSPGNVIVDPDVRARMQAEIDALQAAGVDIIIGMTHLQGIGTELALLPQLRGLDVLIAGGGDELLWNPGQLLIPDDAIDANGDGVPDARYGAYPLQPVDADGRIVPVITTRGDYRYVGRFAATFDAKGDLVSFDPSSGPVRVAGGDLPDAVPADPEVTKLVTEPVAASVAGLAANVIGVTETPLDGRTTAIRSVETNLGNLCADALLWQASRLAKQEGLPMPQVAFQNGGGIRNNSIVPIGNFTELNTFGILPFSNFVAILPEVPAATIKATLENAVSRVSPPPGFPSSGNGRFAQVAGLSFRYEVDRTPGQRVARVQLEDGTLLVDGFEVVAGAPSIAVATINFLATGGDQYPFHGLPFESLGISYQQALFNYVTEELDGLISAVDYPAGGEGRIIRIDNPADLDGNSLINAADLNFLLASWGLSGPADLDGDGIVGSDDLTTLLAAWSA
jgi:5'-nucleotidase/UDP-sugar diphosphatase